MFFSSSLSDAADILFWVVFPKCYVVQGVPIIQAFIKFFSIYRDKLLINYVYKFHMLLKITSMDCKYPPTVCHNPKEKVPIQWTCSILSHSLNHSFTCMQPHTDTQTHFVLHSQSTVYHTQCSTCARISVISWLSLLRIYGNLYGTCMVRIPCWTIPILTEVSDGCSQFFDANATIVALLGHSFLLRNPFQFIIHCHPAIQCYTAWSSNSIIKWTNNLRYTFREKDQAFCNIIGYLILSLRVILSAVTHNLSLGKCV